ncbi:FlgD immunoglobulin-like domain containing protein [Streptomyces graminilatus]|uniref:FlgD immunoglobulin-like domain containing protein n=1 Tax=Streptomyces graminilatus TaxID=1464070 RepID=UPI0006E33CAA|nr:FlgD immunoglobulin-like domain containing protein [Streptomyces graminilatus]
MSRSRRLANIVLGTTVALSCTTMTTPAQAAPAVDPLAGTVRLVSEKPAPVTFRWAGSSGFQYTSPGSGPVLSADYPGAVPPGHAGPDDLASGTDVISTVSGATVTQKHRSTGVTATVTVPAGQSFKTATGWSVLTRDTTGTLHVLRAAADGTTTDTPVTGFPAGAEPVTYVKGGSVRRVAIVHTLDGVTSAGLVDLADGTFRTYATGLGTSPEVRFNDRWLVADWKSIRVDSAPGTEPTALTRLGAELEAVVGDQLLIGNPDFVAGGTKPELTALSLVTGAKYTALAESSGSFTPTPDGGALATGGPSSLDWNVHRVTPTQDGRTATEKVVNIPAYSTGVDGLALAGGELMLYGATTGGGYHRYNSFQLDATAKPVGGQTPRSPALNPSTCPTGDAACPQLEALGDGRVAYLWTNSDGQESVSTVGLGTSLSTVVSAGAGDAGGRIPSASGRYVLYNGGSAGVQKVVDFPRAATAGTVALNRARTSAAVWGQVLWTTGSSQGSVVGLNLKTQQTVAGIATGAPCTPTDIQAVNTWLYWTCGAAGPAGVYDRATNRKIPVPSDQGPARLADGYLLRENRTTHELLLTDFHTGTAATRTVAVLPTADQNSGGGNGRWAVDRFGGDIAYLTSTYGQVALVDSGVPASPLAQTEAQTDPQPGGPSTTSPWQPVWQLNKPATWTLTLANSAGTTVRTLTGSTQAAAVRASWDGRWSDGRHVSGTYTWKLTAEPDDTQGPALNLTGTTTAG